MEIILMSFTFFILSVAILSTYFAIKGAHQLYWLSALSIYIFSYLSSFTIGFITVGLTFVFLFLALAYKVELIKNKITFSLFLLIGIMIGLLMVYYLRDDLFYPFEFFM